MPYSRSVTGDVKHVLWQAM